MELLGEWGKGHKRGDGYGGWGWGGCALGSVILTSLSEVGVDVRRQGNSIHPPTPTRTDCRSIAALCNYCLIFPVKSLNWFEKAELGSPVNTADESPPLIAVWALLLSQLKSPLMKGEASTPASSIRSPPGSSCRPSFGSEPHPLPPPAPRKTATNVQGTNKKSREPMSQ